MNPNFNNRTLYHGDNLDFMRSINSGTVALIATDPPFAKGRDFHATPDSLAAGAKFQDRWFWDKDVYPEWVEQIRDEHPHLWRVIDTAMHNHSESMAAFICFMAVRALSMRRILAPNGSIVWHCDHSANYWLRMMLDAVFGKDGFRNEIVWCYKRMANSRQRNFGAFHDTLLWYTKGKEWSFNADAVRLAYSESSKSRAGYAKSSLGGAAPQSGICELNEKGRFPDDWWDIPILRPNSKERTGSPTQKPSALYRRIIRALSNPGDFVFDPFIGCATTAVAAELEGRQWIGADYWPAGVRTVKDQLAKMVDVGEAEGNQSGFWEKAVHVRTEPLARTDDGETAARCCRPSCGRRRASACPGRNDPRPAGEVRVRVHGMPVRVPARRLHPRRPQPAQVRRRIGRHRQPHSAVSAMQRPQGERTDADRPAEGGHAAGVELPADEVIGSTKGGSSMSLWGKLKQRAVAHSWLIFTLASLATIVTALAKWWDVALRWHVWAKTPINVEFSRYTWIVLLIGCLWVIYCAVAPRFRTWMSSGPKLPPRWTSFTQMVFPLKGHERVIWRWEWIDPYGEWEIHNLYPHCECEGMMKFTTVGNGLSSSFREVLRCSSITCDHEVEIPFNGNYETRLPRLVKAEIYKQARRKALGNNRRLPCQPGFKRGGCPRGR